MTTLTSIPEAMATSNASNASSSNLRAVKVVMHRELIRFRSDRMRIISTLLQPVLYIFVMGTGLSVLTSQNTGVNLRTFIYPGALGMSVMFTAMFSAGSIVWDREFGFLREMLVAPVSRSAIVIGKCLGGTAVATFQGVIILCLAGLAGVPYSLPLIVTVLGEIALLAFALTAFGVMASVRVKTFQGFMGLMQMLIMPLYFTSGAMFPLSRLPVWLAAITRINPLTYAIDPIRKSVFAHLEISQRVREIYAPGLTWGSWHVPTVVELLIIALMGLVMLGAGILQFQNFE
ncbi:MAG TPA: ABC transporter permease [Acidimicrobiales bacterium]|nr:ABC transporter permease [Acidimicrobiales bacterium]